MKAVVARDVAEVHVTPQSVPFAKVWLVMPLPVPSYPQPQKLSAGYSFVRFYQAETAACIVESSTKP